MSSASPSSSGTREPALLVLGLSGAGKSTFVNWAAESLEGPKIPVATGNGLRSTTNDVQACPMNFQGKRFFLVDTPGFDHSALDENEVFTKVAGWVQEKASSMNVCGVIYLHDISRDGATGARYLDFEVLKRLCGSGAVSRGVVVIGTTGWGRMKDQDEGKRKQAELHSSLWSRLGETGPSSTQPPQLAPTRHGAEPTPSQLGGKRSQSGPIPLRPLATVTLANPAPHEPPSAAHKEARRRNMSLHSQPSQSSASSTPDTPPTRQRAKSTAAKSTGGGFGSAQSTMSGPTEIRNKTDAAHLVVKLLKLCKSNPSDVLQIQQELREPKRRPQDTEAGKFLARTVADKRKAKAESVRRAEQARKPAPSFLSRLLCCAGGNMDD